MEFLKCFFIMMFVGLNSLPYCYCNEAEPSCTSRYDFESKLLRSSIKQDFEMNVLKEQYKKDINEFQDNTKAALNRLGSLSDQLKNELVSKMKSFETLGNELKKNVDQKMVSLEMRNKEQDDTLDDLHKLLESQAKEIKKIKKQAVKAPVVFLSRNTVDLSPNVGDVFIFPEIITNIGNAYDPNTGLFTAPVNGTYSFSVQFCLQHNKHVHVLIYADDTIVNNAILYDGYGVSPCETLNTIVYLHQNARVCVKAGKGQSSGTLLSYHPNYRWNMFMGALVH